MKYEGGGQVRLLRLLKVCGFSKKDKRMWQLETAGVLGLGMLFGVMAPANLVQARPDLSGAWMLNTELSTGPGRRAVAEREAPGRRSPVGGSGLPMGGGRGPVSMGGGYGGARQDEEDMAKAREAIRLATIAAESLTIVPDGRAFVVTHGDGVTEKWTPDGKTTESRVGALRVERKIKWDSEALVIERKYEGGVKAIDRYSVTSSPRQLVIASRIENNKAAGERARTLRRVYDAIDR